MLVISKAADLN